MAYRVKRNNFIKAHKQTGKEYRELAEKSNTNLNTFRMIACGRNKTIKVRAVAIAKAMNVKLDDIFEKVDKT